MIYAISGGVTFWWITGGFALAGHPFWGLLAGFGGVAVVWAVLYWLGVGLRGEGEGE